MNRYPEFTRLLNQQLLAHERTATWLAHRLGLHPGTINRWLSQNLRPATPEIVIRIADLLSIHSPKDRQTFLLAAGYGYLESNGPTLTASTSNNSATTVVTPTVPPTHNLPVQPTAFVGRAKELAQLAEQIAQPDSRLLTIVGPGGIGKTRLALELATQQLQKFADGVWFVSLVGVDTKSNNQLHPLVMSLANVLALVFLGQDDPEEQLLRYLQKKEMLLIFDNVEHLLGYGDFFSRLVLKTERIKVVVTSRERLRLREEWIFPLSGLTMPPLHDALSSAQPQAWTSYDAIRLFAQQARRIHPTFDLNVEVDQICRICYLLEGIPLGIELATAWLRQMPLALIVHEIEHNIDFPVSSLRNQPERHRSFRIVFEQSWKLLTTEEQSIFLSLSVFRGSFLPTEAKTVANTSLEILASLVDKSFLRLNDKGRYEMHERIRQYAAEKLSQSPDRAAMIQERYGRAYLRILSDQCQLLMTANQPNALAALTDDLNNVVSAWFWALESGKLSEILCAMPRESQTGFMSFYFYKSWFLEGSAIAAKTIAALRFHCSLVDEPLTNYQKQLVLGNHLVCLALFQARCGTLVEAKLNLQEGKALLRQLDPKPLWELAWAENIEVISFHRSLDSKIAMKRSAASLTCFVQLGDKLAQGSTYLLLGQTAFILGDYEQAESFCHSSLACVEAPSDLGYAYMTLGRIAQERGKVQQAETFYQEALHAWRRINYQQGLCFLHKDLAHIARLRQEYHKAQPYFEQSLELAQRISYRMGELGALLGLAQLAENTGNDDAAEQYFRRMTTLDQELTSLSASALNGLGRIALRNGEQQAAIADFTQSLRISSKAQMAPQSLEAFAGIAAYLLQTGHTLRANQLLSFVYHHPATGHETKQWVVGLLRNSVSEIVSDSVIAKREYSQAMTLEAVTIELLDELKFAET